MKTSKDCVLPALIVLLAATVGQAQQTTTITVQSSQVAADQVDYSLYINLADLGSGFFDKVVDGTDLSVTLGDGTQLDRELVFLDKAAQRGELYARVPLLSSTANTDININYGGGAGGNANSRSTWGPQFSEVWHFEGTDDATCCFGSTINAVEKEGAPGEFNKFVNANDSNPVYDVQSKFGRGVEFPGQDADLFGDNANTSNDALYLLAENASNLNPNLVTVVFWTKIPDGVDHPWNWVYSQRASQGFAGGTIDLGHSNANDPDTTPNGTPFWQWIDNNGARKVGTGQGNETDDGIWHQLVGVLDETEARLYIDGVLFAAGVLNGYEGLDVNNHMISSQGWNDPEFCTGEPSSISGVVGDPCQNLELRGIVDDFRHLNVILSQDDITTLFNNQSSPETFYEVERNGLPGDFDGDDDVDGADFLLAQQQADLAAAIAAWQGGYGTGVGAVSAVDGVPEPSAVVLLLAGLICLQRRSRTII